MTSKVDLASPQSTSPAHRSVSLRTSSLVGPSTLLNNPSSPRILSSPLIPNRTHFSLPASSYLETGKKSLESYDLQDSPYQLDQTQSAIESFSLVDFGDMQMNNSLDVDCFSEYSVPQLPCFSPSYVPELSSSYTPKHFSSHSASHSRANSKPKLATSLPKASSEDKKSNAKIKKRVSSYRLHLKSSTKTSDGDQSSLSLDKTAVSTLSGNSTRSNSPTISNSKHTTNFRFDPNRNTVLFLNSPSSPYIPNTLDFQDKMKKKKIRNIPLGSPKLQSNTSLLVQSSLTFDDSSVDVEKELKTLGTFSVSQSVLSMLPSSSMLYGSEQGNQCILESALNGQQFCYESHKCAQETRNIDTFLSSENALSLANKNEKKESDVEINSKGSAPRARLLKPKSVGLAKDNISKGTKVQPYIKDRLKQAAEEVHSPIPSEFFKSGLIPTTSSSDRRSVTPSVATKFSNTPKNVAEVHELVKKLRALGPNVIKSIKNTQFNKGTLFNQPFTNSHFLQNTGVIAGINIPGPVKSDAPNFFTFEPKYLPQWGCKENILLRAKTPLISEYLLWMNEETQENNPIVLSPTTTGKSSRIDAGMGSFKREKEQLSSGTRKECRMPFLKKFSKNQELKVLVVANPKLAEETDKIQIGKRAVAFAGGDRFSWVEYLNEKEILKELKMGSKSVAALAYTGNYKPKLKSIASYKNESMRQQIGKVIEHGLTSARLGIKVSDFDFHIAKIYPTSDPLVIKTKGIKGIMKKGKVTFCPAHTNLNDPTQEGADNLEFKSTEHGFFTNCYCESCNEAYRRNYMEPYKEAIHIMQGKRGRRAAVGLGSLTRDYPGGIYLDNNSARLLEFAYYNSKYFDSPSQPEPRFI